LEYWIKTDRKHPALKGIQGLLWQAGYEMGEFKGHLYADVLPQLQRWQQEGLCLGVYSSGSVAAQKLLFGFSDYGNINHLFSHNFDTAIGHKQAAESYQNIINQLQLLPSEILFLSDVEAELDAAHTVGINVIQLVRGATIATNKYKTASDFAEVALLAIPS
jgi:enolase-phosphatase E1